MQDLIGKTIKHIKIIEHLGGGGVGDIYLGFNNTLQRKVAVKVLRFEKRLDEHANARFLREAQILSQLNHPNICQVFDYMKTDDLDLLVLELIEGQNLSQALKTGMSWKEKCHIAHQVAKALELAHAMSIIHRDLKPDNVMITQDMQAKVLDFGLARTLSDEEAESYKEMEETSSSPYRPVFSGATMTEMGKIMGTPKYMSPEQARGEPVTAAGDLYAFGLLLQVMFSDRPPYDRDLAIPTLLFRAMNGETQDPEGVDPDMLDLIMCLKSTSPGKRLSAKATVDRLQSIIDRPKRRLKRIITSAFVSLLMVGIIVSSIGFAKARSAEKKTQRALSEAKAVNSFLTNMLGSASPYEIGRDVKVIDILSNATDNLEHELVDQPLTRGAIHFTLGQTYLEIGEFDPARNHFEQSLKLREDGLGENNLQTLETKANLGKTFRHIGQYDQAESILGEAISKLKKHHGELHSSTLMAQHWLAIVMEKQGKYKESEHLHRVILEGRKKALGGDHQDTIRSTKGLAITLCNLGRIDEGEVFFRQAFLTQKKTLGPSHPSTLSTSDNLALALKYQGKLEEAERLFRDTLEKSQEVLGPEHPDTLSTLNNLAVVLGNQGKYPEAEKLHRETLVLKTKVLGEEHPSTQYTQSNLALALFHQDQVEEAESLFRKSLTIKTKVLGPKHPSVIGTMDNLAQTLMKQSRFDEAHTLLIETLALNQEVLGEEHSTTLDLIGLLAAVSMELGRKDEAAEWYQKSLDLHRRTVGPEHEKTKQIEELLQDVKKQDN